MLIGLRSRFIHGLDRSLHDYYYGYLVSRYDILHLADELIVANLIAVYFIV